MKKGFNSLTAEELASTMVSPTFAESFQKNTKENWNSLYLHKAQEKLQKCKYKMSWLNKSFMPQPENNDQFLELVAANDMDSI